MTKPKTAYFITWLVLMLASNLAWAENNSVNNRFDGNTVITEDEARPPHAAQSSAIFEFDSAEQEQRAIYLAQQLRCPRCQNQNLTESNAPIAVDMQRKVNQLVKDGKSDQEIFDYMTERFGDFVLYKPKLSPNTYILWFLPLIILLIFLGFIAKNMLKHKR